LPRERPQEIGSSGNKSPSAIGTPSQAHTTFPAARAIGCLNPPCKDLNVAEAAFHVRPARDEDRLPIAVVFAAVAEERDGIATEPPVDVEARAASWTLDGTFVAVASGEIVGSLHLEPSQHGFGEVGMAVTRE
jgi:hypothetical protein